MAQYLEAFLQRRRGGLPAIGDPRLKQLIGAWFVVPDGDRRQDAHSGDAKGHPALLGPQLHEKVILELILADDIHPGMGQLATLHPGQNLGDTLEPGEFLGQGWMSLAKLSAVLVIGFHG